MLNFGSVANILFLAFPDLKFINFPITSVNKYTNVENNNYFLFSNFISNNNDLFQLWRSLNKPSQIKLCDSNKS